MDRWVKVRVKVKVRFKVKVRVKLSVNLGIDLAVEGDCIESWGDAPREAVRRADWGKESVTLRSTDRHRDRDTIKGEDSEWKWQSTSNSQRETQSDITFLFFWSRITEITEIWISLNEMLLACCTQLFTFIIVICLLIFCFTRFAWEMTMTRKLRISRS